MGLWDDAHRVGPRPSALNSPVPGIRAAPDRLALEPAAGVERRGDRLVATTEEPWLCLSKLNLEGLAGRWVEISYHGGFWDEPARPILRFWQADGTFVDRIAAGPICGAGRWLGRMPPRTIRVAISPTNRRGAFAFAIAGCRVLWWPAVVVKALRWRRKQTRSAVLTKLIGWHPESDVNLAWATGAVPLHAYRGWCGRHVRALDLAGIDSPGFDWTAATAIHIVISGGDDGAVARTRASLETQVFQGWRIASEEALDADALTGVITAGDRMPPFALAYLAEQARRLPHVRLFYGDALVRGEAGTLAPDLKPGWAPRLQQARPFLGRAVFVRGVADWCPLERHAYRTSGIIPDRFVDTLKPQEVMPLRRLMIETSVGIIERERHPNPPARTEATVAIIIPTRDHPALVRRIVASIRAKSGRFADRLQIVIVDNGSVAATTKAAHAELARAADVLLIEHPGPFNFSLMCNRAAAASRGAVLVFLNDDMEVLSEGWLDRLAAHAMDPATGAVGAKLTYPDGRLQHVGVTVGMGESAGHFGALAPGDDPGWAGRNRAVHEVSAVTGACLAVAREKFDAVGGFDAEHLPIELSDIDLCLKLNARGWQTIVDPFVHLMHEESASRGGATLRRLDVYGGERAIFVERWRHVLRDDPTFHPGLSLYSWQAALG